MPAAAESPPIVDLAVESLTRVGLDRPILAGIKWRIRRGEHWAVVGENGSGKSSLLSIVSGDLWPTRGRVSVLGEEYGRIDKRELKKRFGLVSATLGNGLPPGDLGVEIAASGVLAMVGKLRSPTDDERRRAEQALSRVGASAVAGKCYGVMSQGERQRVMIARALVSDPDLLILDEPCGGLDPVARERFLADLARLAAEPGAPTQILVTHHLEEIPAYVTHALVLRQGRVVASGLAEAVLTSSECLTEAFGAPCEVTVEHGPGGRRFRLRVTGP